MIRMLQLATMLCISLLLVCVYLWKGLLISTYVAIVTIILVVFAMCSFLFANKCCRNTNWYKNQFIGTDKFIAGAKYQTNTTRNYDVCNVGSQSGMFAFDYDGFGITGCNWATGSESLSYNFRVLKNYFSFLRDSGIILITITPFGFCLKDYTDDRLNTKYHLYLDPKLIIGDSRRKCLLRIKFPLLMSPYQAMKRMIKDVPADNRLSLTTNQMSQKNLQEDAVRWINGWKRQFSISDFDAPVSEHNRDCIDYNTNLLSEMISFCLERNLKPVLVLPPVTTELNSLFSDNFCESYIYSIIHNANKHHVPFLNYLSDARFSEKELFFNSFFLNAKGRKVFTRVVLSDLKLI